MKYNHKLFILPLVAVMTVACEDLEDRGYFGKEKTNANEAVLATELSCVDYLRQREDLSEMSSLFEATGIYSKIAEQGTLHTILVVDNDHFNVDLETAYDSTFLANSHVTDISIAPSKLNDGDRLLMWHDKYVTIAMDDSAKMGSIINHMLFNNASLQEVISTTDGYIYVISDPIQTPTSLQDFINNLSDDYSIFKDMVLSSGGKTFDRANSKVIGVDAQGNSIYDTVWVYTNDFFDAKDFDLSSEAIKATMFYCSDQVMNDALKEADTKLRAWGMRSGTAGEADFVEGRSDSILKRWFLESAFYNKTYSAADLTAQTVAEGGDETVNDISSIYSRQWRKSVQELDLNNPSTLSNGVAYEVTKLTIPTNVLIYRIKEWFYYYEYCDADQKAEYFAMDNLAFNKTNVDVAAWTPWEGVWPKIEDRVLILKQKDATVSSFQLDFTPISLSAGADNNYTVSPTMVPCGTYRLAMGFKQNLNVTLKVSVYAVDGEELTLLAESDDIITDSSVGTTYHYDRGATLSNCYPEGFDKTAAGNSGGTNSGKAQNYDTDGGLIISEVNVHHADEGDTTPVRLLFRISAANVGTVTSYTFNHWCLRPTANNY
jgi:hypothetical protein